MDVGGSLLQYCVVEAQRFVLASSSVVHLRVTEAVRDKLSRLLGSLFLFPMCAVETSHNEI
jgi:hypothetical protein